MPYITYADEMSDPLINRVRNALNEITAVIYGGQANPKQWTQKSTGLELIVDDQKHAEHMFEFFEHFLPVEVSRSSPWSLTIKADDLSIDAYNAYLPTQDRIPRQPQPGDDLGVEKYRPIAIERRGNAAYYKNVRSNRHWLLYQNWTPGYNPELEKYEGQLRIDPHDVQQVIKLAIENYKGVLTYRPDMQDHLAILEKVSGAAWGIRSKAIMPPPHGADRVVRGEIAFAIVTSDPAVKTKTTHAFDDAVLVAGSDYIIQHQGHETMFLFNKFGQMLNPTTFTALKKVADGENQGNTPVSGFNLLKALWLRK